MNEKDVYSKFVAVFFSTVLIMSAIGIMTQENIANNNPVSLSKDNMDDNIKTLPKHGTRGSSPRTVLAELYTNWGCGFCPRAGAVMYELMDVYDSSQLVSIITHHKYPGTADPFYNYNVADNKKRTAYYSIGALPRVCFDGPPKIVIGGGGYEGTYQYWKSFIETELNELSNMTISLEGHMDQVSLNGTINATIEITDALPDGNLTVKFAVVEDNIYVPSPNGETRHRNVMRDMLVNESLPSLTPGQSYQVSRTFPIDPALNVESISVVVYVQNEDEDSKDVLQAASYDFIPQDILVVDDDGSDNPLGEEDVYHELLSQMEYAFDGWTLNERGSPTSDDLANYKAVIWIIADNSSPTLTTTDQTSISDYLDNEMGSLFLTGQNIGKDIGSTSFYHNYLHSNFIHNNVQEGNISGVINDPISDPFSGTTIPCTPWSPDEISPLGSATTVFQYSPSGKIGGIKAVHDPDSKVVYFAFKYFESSDSDANKTILMERILNWMTDFSFMIPLSEDWNLISIPFIQSDTSFGSVLESIGGEYDSIQLYDSYDSIDPWKHYHDSKPTEMSDLSDINHEIAFWIHVNKAGGTVLSCKGTEPTENQTIDLHIGWNLVGYPSLINREIDVALNNIDYGSEVDSVWTYCSSSCQWQELGPTDFFELGRGYWVHSTVEETWDVPI